jgi:hypothetical protein
MLKQIKYLIIALLFLPILATAQRTQTISGYVFDNQTGLPLDDVYIECDTSKKSVITELSGRFRFDSLEKGEHRLRFIDRKERNRNIDSTIYLTNDSTKQLIVMMRNVEKQCSFYRKMAEKDIKQEKIKLFVNTSRLILLKKDTHFEKKYRFDYSSNFEGCVRHPDDCLREYNKTIDAYLTKTYGNNWKRRVRKDVIF